jgi:HlyD family secretion protein
VTTRESELDTLSDGTTRMKELIFVVENGTAKMRTIKTGISDYQNIEVLEGLSEGDEVISGPYFTVSKELKDGDKIEVTKAPAMGESIAKN